MLQSVQAACWLTEWLPQPLAAARWRGLLLYKVELNQQVQQVCNSPMEKSVAVLGGAEPAVLASDVLANSTIAISVCNCPMEEPAFVSA